MEGGGNSAAFLFAASLIMSASPAAFAESRSLNLVCSGYAGSAPLQNFQALVKLSAENGYGFDYSACAAQDGSDLWFTDADGTVIPHEIDTWTHGGDSFVWVKIPEIVDASTKITLHYGDLSAKQTTDDSVWTGFASVWHMKESGATTEPDMTGNGLDGTPMGAKPDTNMKSADGKVGKCRNPTTYDSGLHIPAYCGKLSSPAKFTISGWWYFDSWGPRSDNEVYSRIYAHDSDMWRLSLYKAFGPGKIQAIRSGGGEMSWSKYDNAPGVATFNGNWRYVAVVHDGKNVTLYIDGVSKYSKYTYTYTFSSANSNNDYGFTIGNEYGYATQNKRCWVGKYDEVRMADGALSADRIAADYKTMNAPTEFLTLAPDVDTALWTGAAGDGDAATAGNWTCYDAAGNPLSGKLPVETTKLRSCTLSANADWTTLGFTPLIPEGSTIDLNGHDLVISGFNGAGIITNSVDAALSTLTLSCGSAAENTATAIGGNIKLLKNGTGTFTSSKALTYTGGTQVDAGTIQAPKSTAAYDETFTPFGTGKITVNANGTFNAQSTVAYTNAVILAGGTIKGGAGSGRSIVMLERVTADSTIVQSAAAMVIGAVGCPIDLGGNRVSVSIASETYFRWFGSLENTTGSITATGADDGYFEDFPESAGNVNIDIATRLNFAHAVNVHDYRAANGNCGAGRGTGHGLYVSGTYTPVGNYYHGCVMEGGSTLDLSGRTGYFTVKSRIDNTNAFGDTTTEEKARKTVQFASGTVTVNLAGRTDLKTIAERADNYIVKWSTDSGMGEPSGTTFKLDAETAVRFKLKKDSTGLQLVRVKGFICIIR